MSWLKGLSETARSWIMLGAITASAFALGAGFMGWVDVPERLRAQNAAIGLLIENDRAMAEQLAEVRCSIEDLSTYECRRMRQRYLEQLRAPEVVRQ